MSSILGGVFFFVGVVVLTLVWEVFSIGEFFGLVGFGIIVLAGYLMVGGWQ